MNPPPRVGVFWWAQMHSTLRGGLEPLTLLSPQWGPGCKKGQDQKADTVVWAQTRRALRRELEPLTLSSRQWGPRCK